MKANRMYAILCAVLLAAALHSCKKSDTAAVQATTNFLTSGPWKNVTTEWQTTTGTWVAPPSWAAA